MRYSSSNLATARVADHGSRPVTHGTLASENHRFGGTRGVSLGNRALGFKPAFLDRATGQVYLACYGDGRPASLHCLDGLPQRLVIERTASGRVAKVSSSVIAGFVKGGRFFTREEAAAAP